MPLNYNELLLSHYDQDALLQVFSSSQFEHRLIGGQDKFHFNHSRLEVGDIVINKANYGFPVFFRGSFPQGMACFGMRLNFNSELRENHHEVPLNQIQLFSTGKELEYVAKGNAEWIAVELPIKRLQEKAVKDFGVEIRWPTQGIQHLNFAPDDGSYLRRELGKVMRFGRRLSDCAYTSRPLLMLLNEWLLHLFAEAIINCTQASKPDVSTQERHALRVMESTINNWLTTPTLDRLRVTEIPVSTLRTLERASRKVYGMTPNRWIKLASLNAAYTELQQPRCTSVAAVTDRWGIGNRGRFAGEYRELFGESPRDTIQRT